MLHTVTAGAYYMEDFDHWSILVDSGSIVQWKNNSNLGINQYNLIWGQNSHKSTLSTDRKVVSII